jgi:hypothetical protein
MGPPGRTSSGFGIGKESRIAAMSGCPESRRGEMRWGKREFQEGVF